MGFDWSDYVKRREGLGYCAIVALTASESAAFERGDFPPPLSRMQRQAGMGEQPSITNDDPTKEPAWLSDKTHSAHVAALLQACARPYTPYPHADSVTDRDPGDETARMTIATRLPNSQPYLAEIAIQQSQSLDAAIARINDLMAELDRAKAHSKFWHDLCAAHMRQGSLIADLEAQNAQLRADLDRLMATPPAPSTAPVPPPHDPMANALAHSEPKPAWQR